MRRFTMFRRNVPTDTHNENQRNAPDEPQFEGVQFTDGRVAIRWMTAKKSTSCWDSMEDMLAIHGHPEYDSELVWSDEAPTTRWDEQRNMPNFIPPSQRALDTQPKFGPAFNRKPPPPPPARHEGKGTDTNE